MTELTLATKIKVDGHETTLREFIHENTYEDADFDLQCLIHILDAKPGDILFEGYNMATVEIL